MSAVNGTAPEQAPEPVRRADRQLLLFTKPAEPGRVKTRLIGDLTSSEAAQLHEAFLLDMVERLEGGEFELRIAWALDGEQEPPPWSPAWVRQEGSDLGSRLYSALAGAAANGAAVAAIGSDHPGLAKESVEAAFGRIEAGADAVLGPAEDGGYYLIALAPDQVHRRLFEDIPWSTDRVLEETEARCRELGLRVERLATGADVDTPEDLRRLASQLERGGEGAPRTRSLLARWGRLSRAAAAVGRERVPG